MATPQEENDWYRILTEQAAQENLGEADVPPNPATGIVGSEPPEQYQTPVAEPPPAAAPPPTPAAPPTAQAKQATDTERAPGRAKFTPATPPTEAPANQGEKSSKLVSTKPAWYEDLAPPGENMAVNGLIGLAGTGLLAALAPDKKSRAAAIGSGLIGTAANLAGAPQRDYDRKLNAASKQADMNEKINSSKYGSARDQLGWAQYQLSVEKMERAAQSAEAKAQLAADKADSGSKVSGGARAAAKAGGWYKPEMENMSYDEIALSRVGAQQVAVDTRRPDVAGKVAQSREDVRHQNAPTVAADAADQASLVTQATMDVKNPMITTEGVGRVPLGVQEDGRFSQLAQRDPERAKEINEDYEERATLQRLNEELLDVRTRVDQLPLTRRTKNDPEFATLVGEWNELEGEHQAVVFKRQDRGAPQVYEDKRYQERIGAPIALEDVPGQPVEAIKSAISNQQAQLQGRLSVAQRQLRRYAERAYGPQGGQAAAPRQPTQNATRPVREAVRAGKKAVGQVTEAVGEAADELDAPLPAAPPDPSKGDIAPGGIIGTFEVTGPDGKTFKRPLTQEQYDRAKGLGYPLKPVQQ